MPQTHFRRHWGSIRSCAGCLFVFREQSQPEVWLIWHHDLYSKAHIPRWIRQFWDRVEIKCPEDSVAKDTTHSHAFDLHFKIVFFLFFIFFLSYCDYVSSLSRFSVNNTCRANKLKKNKRKKERNRGGTLTRRLWQAGSSDFCCQLEASLTFQLPYPSVCNPGGDLSGGNKMRGAIIFPLLLLLFLAWQSICGGTRPECCILANVPPCQYLW